MKAHHQELLDTILKVIRTDYTGDIAIMLIYGSCVNGTAGDMSDLDMIFVPKTDKGRGLAGTFILNGCGYDLWGADWARLERFAGYDDMMVSIIADSTLVHYAAEEDRQRYEALKKRAHDIENGGLTTDLVRKAETHLATATQYYGELCLSRSLTCAGGILYEISDVMCLLNHTFLRFGTKRMLEELSALARLPEGFGGVFEAVVNISTAEQAVAACKTLINMVSAFMKQVKREVAGPAPLVDFAGLYEEIVSQWNKIHLCCEQGRAATALLAAASLQRELDEVQDGLGVTIDDLQFIHAYDAQKLDNLAAAARKAQQAFVELLKTNNISIIQFDSIPELEQSLRE